MDKIQRSKGRHKGSQIDAMKRVRKEMSPPTKVINPKKSQRVHNWRELIDEDEGWDK